jgi:hypothetical protein
MKYLLFFIATFLILFLSDYSLWSNCAIILWVWYVVQLFERSKSTIAFREFLLVLYGLNYLMSPAVSYHQNQDAFTVYRMKVSEADYFALAIPGMLSLQLGLYLLKSRIFAPNFGIVRIQALVNQSILKNWYFFGIVCSLISPLFPGELSFVLYLLSGIRFVAAFGLFALDRKAFKWYLIGVFVLEIFRALSQSMFHDLVMWLLFFGIFYSYISKLAGAKKLILALLAVFAFYVLQVSKNDYRERTWRGGEEGGLSTFQEVADNNIKKGLFTETNLTGSISRVNQAWIFASTVDNMNRTKDYQNLHIVGLYAESALLPRFLAPNKLSSGNKEIFNQFSGHTISSGTSMGLGIFADGYIAYGATGVYIFAFALGVIFCLVFKMIEGWMKISPFFVFFIFPILNYAVRPDCETQTIIGHMVKGLMAFGIMMYFYRKYFARKLFIFRRGQLNNPAVPVAPSL